MSEWAERNVREQLQRGTHQEEPFYRMKVCGNGETKWFNVTPDELQRIAAALAPTTSSDPTSRGAGQ